MLSREEMKGLGKCLQKRSPLKNRRWLWRVTVNVNMENSEKTSSEDQSGLDRIFELEAEIDRMRSFIEASKPPVHTSQYFRAQVEHFESEVKRLSAELIRLRFRFREEGKIS